MLSWIKLIELDWVEWGCIEMCYAVRWLANRHPNRKIYLEIGKHKKNRPKPVFLLTDLYRVID